MSFTIVVLMSHQQHNAANALARYTSSAVTARLLVKQEHVPV